MIVFPIAKINLGLYVTNKRSDGYHDIESIFYPIGLSDILEVVSGREDHRGNVTIRLSGIPVDGNPDDNLVVKAFNLIRKRVPVPSVNVWLHKVIPTGAGLGGGSSDGSAMLVLLNRLFQLGLDQKELIEMALELGSDCPFFVNPVPCLAKGRGEQLQPVKVNLDGFYLYLFHPGRGISTSLAYRNVSIGKPVKPLDQLIDKPVNTWKGNIINAFEPYAIQQQSTDCEIIRVLNESGALFSSLTGSGSAVYGLFDREIKVPEKIGPYLIWKQRLLA
ncbi:MAG: 4-(cytidine 5'-diphospho)-2-C-methyl-D-erythritol kinase [Bacteroidota bacterium]